MGAYWRLLITFGIIGYFLACSPVAFNKLPAPPCQGSGEVCNHVCETPNSCLDQFDVTYTVGDGLVDILIVNDNSGSMSFEQARLAQRFGTFISSLGNLDYRIAMITTDISATAGNDTGPANGNGAFMDGKLLEFAPGVRFITRDTPNKEALFAEAVTRDETLDCEEEILAAKAEQRSTNWNLCPSMDERGIYAANLAIARNEESFFRPKAHLAIIFLADEDVRSGLYDDPKWGSSYPLDSNDRPATLIVNVREKFPAKSLSVHSIIVTPGDQTQCLDKQYNQNGLGVRGSEGQLYAELSKATGGKVVNICDEDYTKLLGEIGYNIVDKINNLPLVCRPVNDYKVSFDPQPADTVRTEANFDALQIALNGELEPGTKVRLQYECKSLE